MSEFLGGISTRAGGSGSRAPLTPRPGGCSGFALVGAVFVCKSSKSCQELHCCLKNGNKIQQNKTQQKN